MTVDVSGFAPDETVFVIECPASSSYIYCTNGSQSSVLADATGAVHLEMRVHRDLDVGPFGSGPTNCAAAPSASA